MAKQPGIHIFFDVCVCVHNRQRERKRESESEMNEAEAQVEYIVGVPLLSDLYLIHHPPDKITKQRK